MEVLLLWLDELEDLIFAVGLVWERCRILCLQTGLLAALCLQTSLWWPGTLLPEFALVGVASGSVVVWFVGSFAWRVIGPAATAAPVTA